MDSRHVSFWRETFVLDDFALAGSFRAGEKFPAKRRREMSHRLSQKLCFFRIIKAREPTTSSLGEVRGCLGWWGFTLSIHSCAPGSCSLIFSLVGRHLKSVEMSTSSSSTCSSSSSSFVRLVPEDVVSISSSGLSSGGMSPVSERTVRALEVMKSLHDSNSIVTAKWLGHVRDRYSIPSEYELHIPWSGQRAYDLFSGGFVLTLDALEAGLRFPFHPVIEACLSCW